MPPQTLRIIDANCNRIGEGLRFLEDIARFILNDSASSHELRTIRHSLVKSLSKFGTELLSNRDSEADVGANARLADKPQNLASLVAANSKRVEEALRVIEEIAKLPEISPILDSEEFKRARFNLYTLEQRLLSRILRQCKIKRVTGLYVILDTQILGTRGADDVARKAIQGGAKIIQLRDKLYDKGRLLDLAQRLKDICYASNVLFIVNDYLDIALAVNADGLHIGQDDLPLPVVRKELAIDKIIGCSTHNLSQALKAQADGADYIAVGAIFPSTTKKDATAIGIEQLRQIKQAISIPVVAISGINKDNIVKVLSAGADSAAVISAVLAQDNIEEATRQLIKEIEQRTESH